MQIELLYLFSGLAVFFTLLIPIFLKFPDTHKSNIDITSPEMETAESGLKGLALVAALISFIFWVLLAAGSVSIKNLYFYQYEGVAYVYEHIYTNTAPLAWMFIGCSIIPLLLLLFLIPESWKGASTR